MSRTAARKWAGLGVASIVFGVVGVVWAESMTTYERLADLDERERYHRVEKERAERRVERWAERLEGAAGRGELAEQARDRLRRRVAKRLTAWERTFRRLERRRMFHLRRESRDVAKLLRFAERRALRRQSDVLGSFAELTRNALDPTSLLRRLASASVAGARHRAALRAISAAEQHVVKRVKRRPGDELSDRLAAAERRLEAALEGAWSQRSDGGFHRKKGTLYPPVSARFLTREERPGETKSDGDGVLPHERPGLTYAVEAGTEVAAAATGRVVLARRVRGYGRTVVVDHGGDYRSIYAHLESYRVELGEEIDRGAPVGRSGKSDSFWGPTLYFELRKEGGAIDPEPWFVRQE